MKYNVLKITTIYAILIGCISLTMIACPEPDKSTTNKDNKTFIKGTKTPTSFTVTFDTNGSTDIDAKTVLSGSTVTKPTTDLKKKDRIFGEWYKKDTEGKKLPFFFDTEKITKDIILYAGWNKLGDYTVRFHPKGGSLINDQIIDTAKDAQAKATKPTAPTKKDLIFVNWYMDNTLATSSTPFDFDTETITKNITLYARWDKPKTDQFTVTFTTDGGTSIDTKTVLSGGTITKPTTAPTKDAFAFVDWYIDSLPTTASTPFNFDTEKITKNITLYAGWISAWRMVAAGKNHTVGIKTDGTLWAWGKNDKGQLGTKNNTQYKSPKQVGKDKDWNTVAAGNDYTVGIKTGGTLFAWGWNDKGQLGTGDTTDSTSPMKIENDTWKAVAAGDKHTVGIKENGTLFAWGQNSSGQLGTKNNTQYKSPEQVRLDKLDKAITWKAIAAGREHTVGIKTDGTLWAWGYNATGQLGTKDQRNRTHPTQEYSKATDWRMVAVGREHTVGIKTDGTLWAWGYNRYSQLGTGDTSSKNVSTQVGKDKWKAVVAGTVHTVGIKENSTLWAWGVNVDNQLGVGDADTTSKNVPTQVGTDTDTWKVIAAGYRHTVGIKENSTLWAWGSNWYNQSGTGKPSDKGPVVGPTLVK